MSKKLFLSTYKAFYYFAGFATLKKIFNLIKSKQKRVTEAFRRPQYSKNSKKLWENGPLCPPNKYSLSYSQNGKEPIFDHQNVPYRVSPTKKPRVRGFYTAFPGGLCIDHYTGEIDVNASDTGIRYTVEFTTSREGCVVSTTLIIGGISYLGGTFNLNEAPDRDKEGNGYIAEPFANGRIKEDAPQKRFKIVNIKELEWAKIIIYPEESIYPEGSIDLKKSILNGALGFRRNANGECESLPENGTSKEINIQYEWYDEKNQRAPVLTQTSLRLHYYDRFTDIPPELLTRVSQQKYSLQSFPGVALPFLMGSYFSVNTDSLWFQISSFFAALLSSLLLLNTGMQGSNNPYKPPERIGYSA